MAGSRLGFGVVGVNPRIRRAILAGIKASTRATLAAVCSRDAERAAQCAAEFGGRPYTSFAEMLADPRVDAVFICTPHALHHPMALAALRAGKRVVCEKPLAVTLAEAEELAATARALGQPALVNFTYHSLAGHRFVARLLAEGAIGTLRHLDLSYWQARQRLPGASPSDALLDVGSHLIDLALWWGDLGQAGTITAVVSQDDRRVPTGSPIWLALIRTDCGVLGSLQADRVAAGWRNGMVCRLVGDAGCLTLDFDTDAVEVRLARFGDGSPEGQVRRLPIPADLAVSYADFPGFHLDRLTAALLGEGEFPDFEHGRQCQRVIEAMRLSAAEQRWVDLTSGNAPPDGEG